MNYLDEVKTIVAGVLGLSEAQLDVNAEMNEIDEWDSMRNIQILQALEENYDILFPEDDIFDLTSVTALAEEIEKLKEK
jgi:acyl carrier protein